MEILKYDPGHRDLVIDVQYNFYGTRLASTSADGSLRIFDVEDGKETLLEELRSHAGPVYTVSWSNPRCGNYIATCGVDNDRGRLAIYEEVSTDSFNLVHQMDVGARLTTVQFRPDDFTTEPRTVIACAGEESNGIGVLYFVEKTRTGWNTTMLTNLKTGPATALSWAPPGISFTGESNGIASVALTGANGVVQIMSNNGREWTEADVLPMPRRTAGRDVSWAPNIGVTVTQIAAADGEGVRVFSRDQSSFEGWTHTELPLPAGAGEVWSLSWNQTGTVLAVAHGANRVTAMAMNVSDGQWVEVSSFEG
ncbi:COPII coat complex component Sec13 A (Sec13A) [Carpediemonas membranifera]|uniref:COPII coat complex component Sec13 A (Sec13A) n=1 Tax=Carpediemonas membranifera TaxID=201153 RepID=A0A8J6B5G5_9EUKA|nr:COPII coat complex component Sec13 A (Sec13A) [Carpediemonas membranifera]|eukprot:KAG9396063.1 COPII coat complex component Sec13 A (Sec13A) [Carpediemonas membranifera]